MSAQFRFISAGAGSGKTYRLTELLLAELQAGRVRPPGVLATTFTKLPGWAPYNPPPRASRPPSPRTLPSST